MDQIINYTSIAGVFAFAISGALTAMHKKLDPFGVLIIAFATSVGGGTIRDVLVSTDSVFWISEPEYIYVIIGGSVFAMIFRKWLGYLRKTLMLFDTMGLALFTVVGLQVGIEHEFNRIICLILGMITGAFGGVLRDILVNDVPLIFKKEIYATISFFGGIIYLLLSHFQVNTIALQIIPMVFIIVLRLLVVHFGWSYPVISYIENGGSKNKSNH
jgi:uncharacterized membrane protein YeiH